jgi:hypothetical protein
VTPKPSGLFVPEITFNPFDFVRDEIASVNLLAIPLFNNGPTFCSAT